MDAKKSLEGYILKVEVVDTSIFEQVKELENMLEKLVAMMASS